MRPSSSALFPATLAAATLLAIVVPRTSSAQTTEPPTTTQPPSLHWTLFFGGDTLLTRKISAHTNPFARIRPPLSSADLAIVNVETSISLRGEPEVKEFTFRSVQDLPSRLARAGVDVGSLANNHSLDFGADALSDTIDVLRSAGVQPVGVGSDLDDALTPAIVRAGGQTVAVFGGSLVVPNGSWAARATTPGVVVASTRSDIAKLLVAVRAAKDQHDVVIVIMHWGHEGAACPNQGQQWAARLLRRAGATAVLGAHPHVLQPIVENDVTLDTRPTEPMLHGLIAYSLGNFIWSPRGGATGDTGLLELDFDGPTLVSHVFHPHRLDGNGWAAAVDPASATGRRIAARTTRHC